MEKRLFKVVSNTGCVITVETSREDAVDAIREQRSNGNYETLQIVTEN